MVCHSLILLSRESKILKAKQFAQSRMTRHRQDHHGNLAYSRSRFLLYIRYAILPLQGQSYGFSLPTQVFYGTLAADTGS